MVELCLSSRKGRARGACTPGLDCACSLEAEVGHIEQLAGQRAALLLFHGQAPVEHASDLPVIAQQTSSQIAVGPRT